LSVTTVVLESHYCGGPLTLYGVGVTVEVVELAFGGVAHWHPVTIYVPLPTWERNYSTAGGWQCALRDVGGRGTMLG
jgi:hypothetical protein